MSKGAVPDGENNKRQSANKKIFEFPTGSTVDFFTHIPPFLALSKLQTIYRVGN